MPSAPIFLDYAATTPLRAEALDAMRPFLETEHGNPASLHAMGRVARKALAQAQETISTALNTKDPDSILFTSGGTESNNLAIKGMAYGLRHRGRHIITAGTEHSAILEPCAWLKAEGFDVTILPVDSEGFVSPEDLVAAIRPDTTLVSLMMANNEVGTVQPIQQLGAITRERGIFFHTDAIQALGKLRVSMSALPVDLLSGSGHKFYGPKGSGFLVANAAAREILTPWLHGGGQQAGFRSGTENVAAIVGMATALQLAVAEQPALARRLQEFQVQLIDSLTALAPNARFNGPQNLSLRVPGNVNLSFTPLEGEALVLRCDLAGLYVSSGSACHSAQITGSHVLAAMGCDEAVTKGSVRFSAGRDTTAEEIAEVPERLSRVLDKAGYFRAQPAAATI